MPYVYVRKFVRFNQYNKLQSTKPKYKRTKYTKKQWKPRGRRPRTSYYSNGRK